MKRRTFPGRWRLAPALAALALVPGFLGCGHEPKASNVKAKVVLKGGDARQLADLMVELQAASDPAATFLGNIDEDGTVAAFGRYVQEQWQPGLPPGDYLARIRPALRDPTEGRGMAQIDPRYQDFKKSGLRYQVGTGDETALTIEVEKRRR